LPVTTTFLQSPEKKGRVLKSTTMVSVRKGKKERGVKVGGRIGKGEKVNIYLYRGGGDQSHKVQEIVEKETLGAGKKNLTGARKFPDASEDRKKTIT